MVKFPIGTFINMAAIAVGSFIGLAFQQTLSLNLQTIILQALGLGIIAIGIQMFLQIPKGYLLVFIFSLIIGGVIGESFDLKCLIENIGNTIGSKLNIGSKQFNKGVITASLLYCVGAMAVVGPLEESLQGKRELLIVKAIIDGFSAIALASIYGIGVLFSIFPILIFQGGISLLAQIAQKIFISDVISCLSSVGGILITAIGLNLLGIGEIIIENLLPSLLLLVPLTWIWRTYKKSKMLVFKKR